MNRLIAKTLILSCVILGISNPIQAEESVKEASLRAEADYVNANISTKDNFIKAKSTSAQNRFLQGNVKASYDDFSELITRTSHDDYVFLTYAIKMAEYGFFDLSEEMINKLDNNLYTEKYINDIHKYYFPSGMVNSKDTLYLADAYTSIVYNNLAIETTSELQSSSRASDSDYKNYLISLGFYKSNNLQQALKFVNNAIIQNDTNINYKILKAKILADSNKPKQALKVLEEINETEFETIDFQTKIKSTEEYILYKMSKDEPLKDYHLSFYYYLQDKDLLATKVLQASILQAKQYSPLIFGLLSRIYYKNDEPLKAQDFAQRAVKEDSKNYLANLTLADLSYEEHNFEQALEYYKTAKKSDKKELAPSIGIAKTYLALKKDKKSKKLYEKLLKNNTNDQTLLIEALKIYPQKADDFLPKVISADINNNDIWLEMADLAIKDENYSMAETFLNNSYYIDENNFKYYYYLSLVLKKKGDLEGAKQALVKCMRLNSDYNLEENTGR